MELVQAPKNIRRLELPPSVSKFVGTHVIVWCFTNMDNLGHIDGQPIQDVIFRDNHPPHPGLFSSIPSFHPAHPIFHVLAPTTPPPIHAAPSSSPIKFTHRSLHPTDILVSPLGTGPARIVAIIDWHQSGWFPEYWEFYKAVYSVYGDECVGGLCEESD
jgi:hypothetical protein